MNKMRSALSDQQLLSAYLSGDKNAISILIERHAKRVRDYIRMMVKNNEIADDIYQETFIKVVKFINEGRYKDNGKFLSWVLRIAHNQVIDHFRQMKQQNNISEADAGYDILNAKKFADPSVEDKIVNEQIESDLRKLIEKLSEEQKEVVMMRYFDEMSFKEIAEQTNVSINTALGRMRYALINLRKMIKENQIILA